MKSNLLTCAIYLLAGSVALAGTTCGVSASGGNRVRFHLVAPALPGTVSASGASPSGEKVAPNKKDKMAEAVAVYKSAAFEKAVPLFQEILLLEPTNAHAHYYYANCLAHQGQNSAARFEYQSTLRYSKNSDLTSYSNQALKNLAALPAAPAISKNLIEMPAPAPHAPGGSEKAAHFDRQLERLRSEVNAEYHHKLDEKRTELNRKISRIKQEIDEEINATPKYYPAHIRTPNLNYETTIAAIQAKGDNKIKILTSDYQEDFRLIDETYGKRLESLASSHQNLKGQMGATVGSSQVTPNGTSFYVRNYINFGGVQQDEKTVFTPVVSPSPGLKAVPLKLKPFR